jgi:hypothetical protein
VADYFKNNRWVVGYDPFNEPFSTETQVASESTFTGQLECFYTGKAHTGFLANGATPLVCPSDVPDNGVIPAIGAVDRNHLIFVEPDIYWVTGGNVPSQLGPMPVPAAGLQLPCLLRRPQPAHRQPHQPVSVPPVRGDSGGRTGHHAAVHELGVPVERTGHLHERVRRDDEHAAGRVRHRVGGIGPGRLGLLGLEVLRRPPPGRRPRAWSGPTGTTHRP